MSERITRTFKNLAAQQRTGLVTFTMAFDPDKHTSLEILKALPGAGVDVIELGMPFSDPMADGPAIEAAGFRALKAGATLKGILEIVSEFRKENQETPLILMGYYNPIQHFGIEAFVKQAQHAGVDGLLIVDLPSEEDAALLAACNAQGISLIKLITPTTSDERLPKLVEHASGFIYYVSVAGITGTKSASADSVEHAIERIKKHTSLPIAVGFGIKDREGVEKIGSHADGVVVGSALVRTIHEAKDGHKVTAATDFVSSLVK